MPNVINYAERFDNKVLEINLQNTVTAPFIAPAEAIKWMGAKTFHFTQMGVTGFKNHSRAGGWNRGVLTQTDKEYTVSHDRDIEFLVDKADVDESNTTASVENVSYTFQKTGVAPEVDALFFEKVCAAVPDALKSSTAITAYTDANSLQKVKAIINKCKRYRGSLVCYVASEIMDHIEQELIGKAKIEWTSISGLAYSIETRVAVIDGTPIIEIIDDDRFYSAFTYSDAQGDGGFTPKVGAYKCNVVVASTRGVFTVPKISSIYFFAPGSHTEGDGYLYQNRQLWDTFVLPNGKDGNVDCVAVDLDTTAVTEPDAED